MSDETETVVDAGEALVVRDPDRAALDQAPAFDALNPRQLQLLRKMNPKVPDAILAQGLEVAWSYQLDPYAKEIWFAENKGSILVMIARDGLRKILARNGLNMACDVVRANDSFTRSVGEHGGVVVHSYGVDRGDIVGAWARVTDTHGTERGYFFAPLSEYFQDRGPWKKQRSVMLLAAAERQAARQATPLGGLLVDGEDLLVRDNERGALTSAGAADMPEAVRVVIERARAAGHAGLSSVEAARMATDGVSDEQLQAWCKQAHDTLDAMPVVDELEPTDAEVVEDDEPVLSTAAMREQAAQLLEDADTLEAGDDVDGAASLRAEADRIMLEVEAAEMDDQGSLL